MFREFRATGAETCGKNRTVNGTVDVLHVLLNSLTPQGLQALFFYELRGEQISEKGAHLAVNT